MTCKDCENIQERYVRRFLYDGMCEVAESSEALAKNLMLVAWLELGIIVVLSLKIAGVI